LKLSEVDLNVSHAIVAIISAIGGYYGGNYLKERRASERRQDALYLASTAAPIIAAEIKGKGITQSDACTATDEVMQLLREVRDELRKYRGDK